MGTAQVFQGDIGPFSSSQRPPDAVIPLQQPPSLTQNFPGAIASADVPLIPHAPFSLGTDSSQIFHGASSSQVPPTPQVPTESSNSIIELMKQILNRMDKMLNKQEQMLSKQEQMLQVLTRKRERTEQDQVGANQSQDTTDEQISRRQRTSGE